MRFYCRKSVLAVMLAAVLGGGIALAGSITKPFSVTVISSDGTIMMPPGAAAAQSAAAAAATVNNIVTDEGTWTFAAAPNSAGDYPLLLNGDATHGGIAATLAQVTNGRLYVRTKASGGHYFARFRVAWYDASATAPVQGTVATKVTLTQTMPQIPDNSPAGTVVATAKVDMAPPGAAFTGPLVSSNPFYTFRGTDIVLARDLAGKADDGNHTATIWAIQ
jgi:hypothetical protein